MANPERVSKALDLLRDGIVPNCEATWSGFFGDAWLNEINQRMHHPESDPTMTDVAFVLKGIKATWNDVWSHNFANEVRSLVFEVATARNRWAHQDSMSSDDTMRALDSMERLLEAFGNEEERKGVRSLRRDLMRQMFDEESRSERRKTAAKPTEGQPQAGLTPWREIITPHADVASGRFNQAEFAADLNEVANGDADSEYQDPVAFFGRTFLTEGLKDLLVGAARRLSGDGGEPVIELQTNFGGGKTHSMIALYHLASDVHASKLAGVGELLSEAGIELPSSISRAVLVGQKISVSAPMVVEDGVALHTLWGHLAYQLGGKAGYELVRTDDENGTNPGDQLKVLFKSAGPTVILIDEWVAYARQLRDGMDKERLAGGDFDTQFTFAQQLTEAASSVDNVVLLVSIPASDIEVGGDRGKIALEKLKNVVTRKAAQWQPASPDESFEIVRRRLFDPISPENAKVRDGVIRAFAEMYRTQLGEFPSGTSEDEYRRRMELSYPIHPELFDRLFGDWSALDKFQRTRGVLRLMALVVSQLWQRDDRSLLIMPGTLPMDSGPLVSEMKKYLEEGWDPVIKSDVDGENSLPLRIDTDNPHFGRVSATRRAARTVYMSSAPRPDGTRGVDIKSVVLGCAQPGESPAQFADALKRLSNSATHLYSAGQQYWYSLQPNVSRLAADRAASNFSDRDADDEAKRRIESDLKTDRGNFATFQVFAEGPGDVPDDDGGVRLVVLTPDVVHAPNDKNSSATTLADAILSQREGGPRLNRNLLVFVAAAASRLAELRAAGRLYLAWQSIVNDYKSEVLDLALSQSSQATERLDESSLLVNSLIGETFTQILTPEQTPGTPTINWRTAKAVASGDFGTRITKKLSTEEKLIATYGGVRVKMDIDNHTLWSDRHDITVSDLWSFYCCYPYLPRLASRSVLELAISNGTSNMNWAKETYAYAEAHDGTTWVGLHTGEHVAPEPSGFLVHPDFIPEPEDAGGSADDDTAADGDNGGGGNIEALGGQPGSAAPTNGATSFYALFDLDSVNGIKQLGKILEHVVDHLGADVEIALEVRAKNPAGFTDAAKRSVSENAANLGAQASEFE